MTDSVAPSRTSMKLPANEMASPLVKLVEMRPSIP